MEYSLIDKSDHMLFTNISDLQIKDKRTNDLQYIYQMSQNKPRCLIDRGDELHLLKNIYNNKTPLYNNCIATRGGNSPGCEPERSCPKPEYSKYYLNEFLLVPCPKPTYKNYLVGGQIADNSFKYCSKRHQLFKNITKRKDITGQ